MNERRTGRYQLWFKAAGQKPYQYTTTFESVSEFMRWLKTVKLYGFKNYKSGFWKMYIVDNLTGHEAGSTLDLIDRDN